MSRRAAVLAALVLAAFPIAAVAQDGPPPGGGQGSMRVAPLPDHWMTLDSLAAAVTLTAAQREQVTGPYTALNGVMQDAANRRRAMRERMQTEMAGRSPQDVTEAERAAFRARADSLRGELEELQAEADQWYATIRNLLTPEQQPKFDALAKPVLLPPMFRQRAP